MVWLESCLEEKVVVIHHLSQCKSAKRRWNADPSSEVHHLCFISTSCWVYSYLNSQFVPHLLFPHGKWIGSKMYWWKNEKSVVEVCSYLQECSISHFFPPCELNPSCKILSQDGLLSWWEAGVTVRTKTPFPILEWFMICFWLSALEKVESSYIWQSICFAVPANFCGCLSGNKLLVLEHHSYLVFLLCSYKPKCLMLN